MFQRHISGGLRGRAALVMTKGAGSGLVVFLAALAGATAAGTTQAKLGAKPALLLMGGVAAAGLVVVFAHARQHVLLAWPVLTGAAYAFVQEPRGNPVVTFDRIWVFGLLAVIAVAERSPTAHPARRFFVRCLMAFIAVWCFRALTSSDLNLSLAQWVDALVLPLILFTATRLYSRTPGQREQIAGALVLGGLVLAGIGIAEHFIGFELATRSGGALRVESELATVRISGPYPVPEPYALSLLMCYAATLYWTQLRAGGRLLAGSSIAAIELAAIGFTLFRAAWIGAAVITFVAIGIRRGRWMRAVCVGSILAIFLLTGLSQIRHSTGLQERVDNTDNVWGRLATYQQGVDMFRSHPLFGVGINRYHPVAESLPPRVIKDIESVTFAHSSYVLVLAEQGLFGFGPFLLLTFASWRLIRALRRTPAVPDADVLGSAVLGAGFAYLVMSLTLTMIPYSPSNCFFAMLLGLVAGCLEDRSVTAEAVAPR